MKLSCGPLQGSTDAIFRQVHHKIWGGIDEYFGPYLRLDNHKEPKASQIRDIESPLNEDINYVPQLMGNNPELLLNKLNWLKELGYTQANWNLGCPYPMVTNRNMGSGLLNQPQLVKEILDEIMDKSPIEFSIKCRLGLLSDEEIFPLIEVFNQFDLKEIIIHTRIASQLYKGTAKPGKILPIIEKSNNPIAYNGDIHSIESFNTINKTIEGKVNHLMLGRGLLMRPFLAAQIKGKEFEKGELHEKLRKYHDALVQQYSLKLQDHQLLMKMRGFWEYFAHSFTNPHKTFKLIKKSSNIKKYELAVNQIFISYTDFE